MLTTETKKQIENLIKSSKVFLFMKGTPENPMCGFSMKSADTLKDLGIQFESFDVLSDNSIREGVKEYANWPTIPQLFVNGKFIGGADILVELAGKGELGKMVGK
ncbi:Grx4 family monothiol glutaredoxin [Candidatus Pacearchaeota archaeon]|nr:Grx4 family monothiol glutaredoxin [Candidatus Pacearchaeota archaeon]